MLHTLRGRQDAQAPTTCLTIALGLQVVEPPPSVVHRFDPELSQLSHALAHLLDHLRRRTLPARDLLDDRSGSVVR